MVSIWATFEIVWATFLLQYLVTLAIGRHQQQQQHKLLNIVHVAAAASDAT